MCKNMETEIKGKNNIIAVLHYWRNKSDSLLMNDVCRDQEVVVRSLDVGAV